MSTSSDPLTLAFAAPTKSSRTASIIRDAVNAGRPLPLAVILETMWKWRDEAIRLEDSDPLLARQYRNVALLAAEKAAPYVHPRLANVAVRPEDEIEAQERRQLTHSIAASVEGKSVKELGRMWLAAARGEKHEQTGLEINGGKAREADSIDPLYRPPRDEEEPQEPS